MLMGMEGGRYGDMISYHTDDHVKIPRSLHVIYSCWEINCFAVTCGDRNNHAAAILVVFMHETSDLEVWDIAGIPIVVRKIPALYKMPGFHHYSNPR